MQKRRGSSMVEFALAAPVLLLLLAGILNYGSALRIAMCVSRAARAGAQYGSLTQANATDSSGMAAAARAAAPNIANLTATGVKTCQCADGSAVSCSGSCLSNPMRIYVEVRAGATAPNLFSYPGLPFTGAVSAKAVMRVR